MLGSYWACSDRSLCNLRAVGCQPRSGCEIPRPKAERSDCRTSASRRDEFHESPALCPGALIGQAFQPLEFGHFEAPRSRPRSGLLKVAVWLQPTVHRARRSCVAERRLIYPPTRESERTQTTLPGVIGPPRDYLQRAISVGLRALWGVFKRRYRDVDANCHSPWAEAHGYLHGIAPRRIEVGRVG
jgi:hypothetical protein